MNQPAEKAELKHDLESQRWAELVEAYEDRAEGELRDKLETLPQDLSSPSGYTLAAWWLEDVESYFDKDWPDFLKAWLSGDEAETGRLMMRVKERIKEHYIDSNPDKVNAIISEYGERE